MTDHTPTTEGNEPDGFVVIHYPVDGSEKYGVGPFPFIDELARRMVESDACRCKKEALSIAFPRGVTMMVHGIEMDAVMQAAMELAEQIMDREIEEKEAKRDRLN